MKYIKFKILEWRDQASYADLQHAAAELNKAIADADSAMQAANEIEAIARQSGSQADQDLANAEKAKACTLASLIITAKTKLSHASEIHTRRAFINPMVGTFGYQEIDSATMTVIRLLDESGQPYPRDAVFGHDVVDADPPFPSWGIPDLNPAPNPV